LKRTAGLASAGLLSSTNGKSKVAPDYHQLLSRIIDLST